MFRLPLGTLAKATYNQQLTKWGKPQCDLSFGGQAWSCCRPGKGM